MKVKLVLKIELLPSTLPIQLEVEQPLAVGLDRLNSGCYNSTAKST